MWGYENPRNSSKVKSASVYEFVQLGFFFLSSAPLCPQKKCSEKFLLHPTKQQLLLDQTTKQAQTSLEYKQYRGSQQPTFSATPLSLDGKDVCISLL